MAFRAVLRKGFLVLIKALSIFLFCFTSSWIANVILVLGLIVFSERIVAALLIILIGSVFSEDVRSRIWSCRIVSWLEREKLIESKSALWYNLTLMGGKILLLKFVKKPKRMAEWSEERSLFKVRFWMC